MTIDLTDNKTYISMLNGGRRLTENTAHLPELRVAVLADHATQQLTLVLKSAILEQGFFPVIYEAEYATASFEAFDKTSGLHEFKPQAILLSMCVQKYRERFFEQDTPQQRAQLPQSYADEVIGILDALESTKATVVVNNFAPPIERGFGNFAIQTTQSLYGSVMEYNYILTNAVNQRRHCALNDIAYLASFVGTFQFFDERMWLSAKYFCATRFLPDVTRSIARCIAARKGKASKVLVLDLDNTLWGGVIGDDGMDGIALGGDAHGEAFQLFQKYILSLKQRGYVLAVCSKNTESIAMEVFKSHPEMIIREEDIAVFVANWNDKASNIEYIARVLNLGLDSFVFIDDSAFERDLVKTKLPMVSVPFMPEDPAEYVVTIERSGVLEASSFSDEDVQRNQAYREEAIRSTEQIKYSNIEEYLESLSMNADCGTFKPSDLPRVAQLIQRSNQFNLRTQRVSEAECAHYMTDNDKVSFQVRLNDRFGDYGLISVICCDVVDGYLFINELVMSCRVLKRGVEHFIMNHLFDECRRLGLKGIRGQYIASAKNGMVKEFYGQFNFHKDNDDGKISNWHLDISDYQPQTVYIRKTLS